MGRDCEQDYLDFRRRLLAEGRAGLLDEFNDYGWYLSHVVKLVSGFFDSSGAHDSIDVMKYK